MKPKRRIIGFSVLFLLLTFHGVALADDACPMPPDVPDGVDQPPCNAPSASAGDITIGPPEDSVMGGGSAESALERLIEDVIDFIFWVGLIICPLIVVIGGLMYMTAGGDFSRATSAKRLILWAIIGLAVAVAAKFIIGILKYILDY